MARGESSKASGRSAALGLWSILGVVVLSVGFLVASALEDCSPSPAPLTPAARSARAFESSFAVLHDRDATGDLSELMAARGHVRLASPAPEWHELPFELVTTELEGACGVLAIAPDPTSMLVRLTTRRASYHQRIVSQRASVAVCGVERIIAVGTGRARVERWTLPGLTPGDVEASGLSAEAAIAFAEAEALLQRNGWIATDRALRIELGPGVTDWRPPRPASGCVGWVLATFRFDGASSTLDGAPIGNDSRPGRQLLGAASCHDGGEVRFDRPSSDGGLIYALPFSRGGGPRLPGSVASGLTHIPDVRVTAPETLELLGEP